MVFFLSAVVGLCDLQHGFSFCNHDEVFFACYIQVEFYVNQTKADNHAVREAACACIAELGTKVG